MWAKQSTAATLIVGPILDSAGAEYTSAVIGDLSLSKNGGTLTALASAATLTHIANGQYTLVMTTGNVDTLGRAQITCNKSTYQMPAVNLMVVPAMVFDSLVLGTDVLQSDTTQFGGTAITAAAGIPEVKVASIASNAVNASALASDAVTEIQSGLATQASVDDLPTNAELATALGTADDAVLAAIATVQSDTNDIQTRLPAALVGGKMDSTAVLDSAVGTQITAIETFATRMTTGLVVDGAVYQFTANMLELGPSGGGGSSVNVLPATGIVADRSAGTTLLPVVGETISQSITVYQSDGTTAVSLSGKTLKVIFETMSGVDVAVVAAADITISGASSNVVTFAYPSAVTASERTLRFAIRDAAAPLTMYLQGVCSVVAAPKVDA
jgi:hypothetical protein